MHRSRLMMILVATLAAYSLAGCAPGTTTEENSAIPEPTLELDDNIVSAQGEVIPERWVNLAFTAGGNEPDVLVAPGDSVKKDMILAQVNDEAILLEVATAERTLRELTSQVAIATAEQAVADAEKAADDAQKKVNTLNRGRADEKDIDYYESQLTLAKQALDRVESAWQNVTELSTADPKRARAETDLHNAQRAYNAARANLNWAKGTPSENEYATAEANLAAANAAYQEAHWYLATLKGEPVPEEATGSQLAQLQQIRDNLKAAQDRLANSKLQAPFNGVIVDVFIQDYESVAPNQPVVLLADLTNLVVQTTDMGEVDVARVQINDPARIVFDALPGVTATGRVSRIALRAEQGSGVYYTVTIELDEIPEDLRWGMSAFAEIEVSR
jgi:multidrug resistance efflux pump